MYFKKIQAYTKGLVYKNNKYLRTIGEGRHWIANGEEVVIYDMAKPFTALTELNFLLQDDDLAAMLEVVQVNDNELALMYEHGMFKSVLPRGRYVFWKGIIDRSFVMIDTSNYEITQPIDRATLTRPELQPFVRTYVVESYEQGVLYVDARLSTVLQPGVYYYWKNPVVLTVYKADMRQLQLEMNSQEILTKDKANLRINFSVQYRIVDILKAVENKEYEKQLYTVMQMALRELVAIYTLDELLDKRDVIANTILSDIQVKVATLGVTVINCGIKDIILPGDMKDIMNQVLIAEKKAQANIIMRREETASTRSLLNTAKLMEENEMLFRLKEMEYVEKIADRVNSLSVNGGDLAGQLRQIFMPAKR